VFHKLERVWSGYDVDDVWTNTKVHLSYCGSAAAGWLPSMMPQRLGSLTPESATHQSQKEGRCRESECRRHKHEAQDHGLSQAGVHLQYIEQTG